MKSRTSILALSLTLLTSCLISPSANAQLFYEGFNNVSGSNQTLQTFGNNWQVFMSDTSTSNATEVTSIAASGSNNAMAIASLAGNPNTSNGFLFATNNAASSPSTRYAAFTTFSSLSVATGSTVSFTMGNAGTGSIARVLVQSGGNWYAHGANSGAWFSNSTTYTSSTFSSALTADVTFSFTFNPNDTLWRQVTIAEGSPLDIPTTLLNLPSSSITGIGFFVQQGGQTQVSRFDSLTITAVPEPSTFVLLGIGGLTLGLLRFRKKN